MPFRDEEKYNTFKTQRLFTTAKQLFSFFISMLHSVNNCPGYRDGQKNSI